MPCLRISLDQPEYTDRFDHEGIAQFWRHSFVPIHRLIELSLRGFQKTDRHLEVCLPRTSANGTADISPRRYAASRSWASRSHRASTASSGLSNSSRRCSTRSICSAGASFRAAESRSSGLDIGCHTGIMALEGHYEPDFVGWIEGSETILQHACHSPAALGRLSTGSSAQRPHADTPRLDHREPSRRGPQSDQPAAGRHRQARPAVSGTESRRLRTKKVRWQVRRSPCHEEQELPRRKNSHPPATAFHPPPPLPFARHTDRENPAGDGGLLEHDDAMGAAEIVLV